MKNQNNIVIPDLIGDPVPIPGFPLEFTPHLMRGENDSL